MEKKTMTKLKVRDMVAILSLDAQCREAVGQGIIPVAQAVVLREDIERAVAEHCRLTRGYTPTDE